MLREFFAPRLFIIFLALWALLSGGLYAWFHATRARRRQWLRAFHLPLIAAVIAFAATMVLAALVTKFD